MKLDLVQDALRLFPIVDDGVDLQELESWFEIVGLLFDLLFQLLNSGAVTA